jgi:hypothetical protein
MRARWVVLWSIGIFCGAVLLRPVLRMVPLLRMLERSELVHVAAHLFLYGGLTALARWSGMSTARAGALALAVGVAQEGLQIAMARRGFGSPEVFESLRRRDRHRRRPAALAGAEDHGRHRLIVRQVAL